MKPFRVFFAQPVDSITPATINENIARFKELTNELQIEVITPYTEDILVIADRESAKRIVNNDYSVIETCEIYLADISKLNHQFVGIFF